MNNSIDFTELAQLINQNSYTKNKAGIDADAEVFNAWMADIGFEIQTFEREHLGNHVHYKSPKTHGKRILLLGHFDTVFPPNTFEGFTEDSEWIYGPGVCDMKGGNYVALQALRNVKQRHGKITNIDMLIVSDEETGSDDSKALTKELATQYDACFVFEAAGKNDDVVISRKGIATFTIIFEGKGAHAGNHYTDGINANLSAAHMLLDLTALTDIDKGTTVNVGKMKGGIGANTISPHAELVVEARFTNPSERDRVIAGIDTIIQSPKVNGIKVKASGGLQRDVMQSTPEQALLIKQIETITGQSLVLERRGGVSDANVVAGLGVPTLDGFGPFGDGDHTVHERAEKASFTRRIDLMTNILCELAG